MNNVSLTGRITKDPEVSLVGKGEKKYQVIRFTIAVQSSTKVDGAYKADFIQCTAWNKTAEFIEKYISKGDLIEITGEIKVDQYKNKNDDWENRTYVNISKCLGLQKSSKPQPAPEPQDRFMTIEECLEPAIPFN